LETPQFDIWVTTSTANTTNPPADILSNYHDAVGHAPVLPYYASGFWQCKDRYRNQTELLSIVEGYRSRDLPLDIIVIDWYNWIDFGDWYFNPVCWPDPSEMVQLLSAQGVEVMVSVWPVLQNGSKWFPLFDSNNYLITCPTSKSSPFCRLQEQQATYDPSIPNARAAFWNAVNQGYYNVGVKHYWLDACEPERFATDPPYQYSIGSENAVGSLFPVWHAQSLHDGLVSQGSEVLLLSRSSWAGMQKLGSVVWSGDTTSNFPTLSIQVQAGLNMGLSGIVWWTTDTGGFGGGTITDPVFQQLIVRWFQFSTFCPILRLHGDRNPQENENTCGFSGGPNEVWEFGETAYEIISGLLQLREVMRPYIMTQMELAAASGVPVMRPIWWDFPNDPIAATIEDQYMFGPDFLVCPVVIQDATNRSVYLPAGASWSNFFTNQFYEGNQTIIENTPIQTFPLYIRTESSKYFNPYIELVLARYPKTSLFN